MNPLFVLVDKIEELMGHSPHPAIVAVPLGAWTVSNVCDGLAVATGSETFDDAARISMGIGLAGAVAAAVTGWHDYVRISQQRPAYEVATTHGLGNVVATTLMAGSFILRGLDHQRGERPSIATRLLGLSAGGLTLYTGWLGGKLVEEMGVGVHPVQRQMRSQESAMPSPESAMRSQASASL